MSSVSSNSSRGEVILELPPVKQISPAKAWCFTLNNFSDDDLNSFSSIVPEYCSKAIIGKEVGESGTPHLQGYIFFKTKRRPKSVFKFSDKIHFEKARGTPLENFNYCSKDGDIFLNIGFPRPLKKLPCEDDMDWWQCEICEWCEQEPDDRTIHWYWSEEGSIGKTTFAKYLHRKYGAICLGGKSADMKNGVIEYQKANGTLPSFVIINLPRSFDSNYLSYTGIEEIKDMFFYSGKYEGGMVDGNSPHVLIFSNEEPNKNEMSKDRWHIVEITR